MPGRPRCAVGVPTVSTFGDPRMLVELAVAAEEAGWDGFFLWDHLLWRDPGGHVADPTVVISAVASRTERIRFTMMPNRIRSVRAATALITTVGSATCPPGSRQSR